MDIANKTVLITGANRGIGQAVVAEALRRGAKRIYAGTRGSPLTADPRVTPPTADPRVTPPTVDPRVTPPTVDPRVTPLLLDVTNATQVQQAAARIDHLDVLVNNAGIALSDDLGNLDVIQQHLEVNLFGLLRVTNAFLPLLRRSKGALVNHLSIVALAGMPIIPAYSVSKAAALNLTQSLRALLAAEGVSIHGVLLGPIDTDMNRGLDIPKASTSRVSSGHSCPRVRPEHRRRLALRLKRAAQRCLGRGRTHPASLSAP
jgi:NAD(P)-dependent dehydrogenase (short-subunit alcohol dehydrogenase family)